MSARAARQVAARQAAGQGITLSDAWQACPFRTLLAKPSQAVFVTVAALAGNIGSVLALIEDRLSPIEPSMMGDIQQDLARGKTVLLLAVTREVRDHAKATILTLAEPARGSA